MALFTMRRPILACVTSILLLATAARAEPGGEGVVAGVGRVSIKRPADTMRMAVVLSGDGKDIAEAVAAMKAKQTAAAAKLTELGANAKSIEWGSIVNPAAGGANPQQAYMQRMMQMRGNRGQKPPAPPTGVTVTCTLKAEWPLASTDGGEDPLVAASKLEDKIRKSDLLKKPAKTLTPEEQEAAEEMQGMDPNAGQAPGTPTFQYLSRVNDAEQATATAEAFQKAKVDAARLAKASGNALGALRQLSSTAASPTGGAEDEQQAYARMAMRQMGIVPPPSADVGEAVAAQPGPVELQIVVTATFALKG